MSRPPDPSSSSEFSSTRWDPTQYERFAGPRIQPALDLLARVPERAYEHAVDLGCGTGEITARLADRFPSARALGIDSSAEMIEKARAEFPGLQWAREDLASWEPQEPVDLIYSNAALHWVADHGQLVPRLLGHLRSGGVLAVQVPCNQEAPSHRLIREILRGDRTGGRAFGTPELRAMVHHGNVADATFYDRVLRPRTQALDIWQTEYLHRLQGEDPVVEWVSGTTLRPVLQGLEAAELEAFLEIYREALREAYPPEEDGTTLFPFRRLFWLAIA